MALVHAGRTFVATVWYRRDASAATSVVRDVQASTRRAHPVAVPAELSSLQISRSGMPESDLGTSADDSLAVSGCTTITIPNEQLCGRQVMDIHLFPNNVAMRDYKTGSAAHGTKPSLKFPHAVYKTGGVRLHVI